MDDSERALFTASVEDAVRRTSPASLDRALDELGWRDALAADRASAVSVLFECQGHANATSTALDDLLLAALGLDEPAGTAVVLPGVGTWDPPGDVRGRRMWVHGLGTARLAEATSAVVVATTGAGSIALRIDTARCHRRPLRGLDETLGLVAVDADLVGTELPAPPAQRAAGRDGSWPTALGIGQLALAHELVGASTAMIELARAHALERVQFGRPVAAFQAVRHRLADTYVAVEAARALLDAAWEQSTPHAAAMAKAMAGQAARTAARHCQQVLGGMGFTTEHPLHRYVRRVLVLDELLGSSRALIRSLGRQLVDSRQLPPLLPL